MKSISNKTKGDNSKRKPEVIFLHDISSCLVLHFYQVSLKHFNGYSSYRVDKKFYVDADGIRPKNNMFPHPLVVGVGGELLIFSQSDYFIQVVDANLYT